MIEKFRHRLGSRSLVVEIEYLKCSMYFRDILNQAIILTRLLDLVHIKNSSSCGPHSTNQTSSWDIMKLFDISRLNYYKKTVNH